MMTKTIFDDAALDADWDLEAQIQILLEYIDQQENDDDFRDFLEEKAATNGDYD